MINAMLLAYRRTLHKTMEQARSMRQVVQGAALPWLETPDQALVWSVALGLRDDVDLVLRRSVEDLRSGSTVSSQAWLPAWFVVSSLGGGGGAGAGGFQLGPPDGMFSSGAIPDLGNMLAAVGTIGDSPASSGSGSSGSSGGFSGGSSGGGGGGAGGGF
jgi:hypothetical protein